MFGVTNPDFRDQYPRFLGGTKQIINVTEVLNTSAVYDSLDALVDPQGNQVGHGVGAGSTDTINFHATEHGILMSILHVKPAMNAYTGGIERFFLKTDRTEFFNHHFENIGDQPIYDVERGYDSSSGGTSNMDEWAYAPRFAEYKSKMSIICGEFKDSMDDWHMGQVHDTATSPTGFNEQTSQVLSTADENLRIFVDQTTSHKLYIEVFNDVQVILPMKVQPIPY